MTSPAPAVGRVVHYVAYGTPGGEYPMTCRAATITETYGDGIDTVGLAVLNPTGMFFNRSTPHDAGTEAADPLTVVLCDGLAHRGGTWHWPARV